MSDIGFDVAPGYYLNNFTINMQLSARVQSLQYSVNGGAPALSKYIAYDTSTPPVPFVAVTDDGRGRVVYDGGFPKFYNSNIGNTSTQKYLLNVLRYLENPTKRAQGNNKVLLVGDASAGSYMVKDEVNASGFAKTFKNHVAAAGYALTIKDRSDWGGTINATVTELEQYCLVLFMSSVSQQPGDAYLITPECVEALMTYRENGNGIMLITDHGPVINSITEAASSNKGGFFGTANAVAVNFGAWFSGDYNRSPVNIGFLRTTYGDHPLYNGMSDSDSFYAGASESRVFVAQYTSITPAQVTPINITSGRTVIQVAAVLTTGEIVTYRATYWVGTFKMSFKAGAVTADNGQQLDVGVLNQQSISPLVVGTLDENASGIIYHGSKRVGTFQYTVAGGGKITWDSGVTGTFNVKNGDEFKVVLSTPFTLTSAVIIKRFQPAIDPTKPLPTVADVIRQYKPELSFLQNLWTIAQQTGVPVTQSLPKNIKTIGDYFKT